MFKFISSLRMVQKVFNLWVPRLSKNQIQLLKKVGVSKNRFHPISSRDFSHLSQDKNWLDKGNSRMLLPDHPDYDTLPWMYQVALTTWSENGFVILNKFFEEHDVDKANISIEKLLKKDPFGWQKGNRLLNCYKDSEEMNAMANHPYLLKIVNLLMDKEMELYDSHNSQKSKAMPTQADAIQYTTFPLGNSISIYIALEDISKEQGPLHFYPQSHQLPYVLNDGYINHSNRWRTAIHDFSNYLFRIKNMIVDRGLNKRTFTANKGDVMIFHNNLLHGNEAPDNEALTCRHAVFRYFAKDVVRYCEWKENGLT